MADVNALTAFVEKIRQARQDAEQQDWTFQEPPEPPPRLHNNRLQWKRSESQVIEEPMTVEELRQRMPGVMKAYILQPKQNELLLMKVAAGSGKTHCGVVVAQWAAQNNMRVLWASGRHNLFEDIRRLSHFDPALWYHWLPIHEESGADDPIPTTCRYCQAQAAWGVRGYDSFDLCIQLCSFDQHLRRCLYRNQAKKKQPIVFAMHNHLASGLAIDDFDVVMVDELPLNAFVEHRVIPPDAIRIPGTAGPLEQLVDMLHLLTRNDNKTHAGPELFKYIGPILRDVFAQVEVIGNALPQVPTVNSPDDVANKPYWYLMDLLLLASPEYDAWRNLWPRWTERIKVNERGLHLLQRAEPWEKLPKRMIVLDATASVGMYRQLFDRPVREYQPQIKRKGHVFQVTSRLNGVGQLLDDKKAELTRDANELLEISRLIAGRYSGRVGIACNKSMRSLFEREYGESNVEHYYALRGTNNLQDVECLIVAGSPAPDLMTTINTTAALNRQRILPYGVENEHGYIEPLFYEAEREYRITAELRALHDGKTPWRKIKGFWSEPDLQAVYETTREHELLQAIHRARPNVRECDVWVLTSTPTHEPLDGIWDDPPIGPEGIYWKTWLELEPWLMEQWDKGQPVTTQMLADAMRVNRDHVSRNNWLHAIASYLPDQWEETLVPSKGRPNKGIAPFIRAPHTITGYQ